MYEITRERAAADRRMVDAIREAFGMAPLYGAAGDRKTEAERFAIEDPALASAWTDVHRHNPESW